MPLYKVKPGCRHGAHDQYGEGDVVELDEDSAFQYRDKLESITFTEAECGDEQAVGTPESPTDPESQAGAPESPGPAAEDSKLPKKPSRKRGSG